MAYLLYQYLRLVFGSIAAIQSPESPTKAGEVARTFFERCENNEVDEDADDTDAVLRIEAGLASLSEATLR